MKIYSELDFSRFEAWSGAVPTFDAIYNAGKYEEFEQLIEELYPDGISETQLNDILWFEPEWCFEMLGIEDEDDELFEE